MKTKIFFLCLLLSLIYLPAEAQDESLPPLPKGPLILSGAAPEMQNADFWIKRLPDANQALKTPEEIAQLNKEINETIAERTDVFKIKGMFRGIDIKEAIEKSYETIKSRKLFGVDDKYITKDLFTDQILPNLNLDAVPNMVNIRWGVATTAASVRALPIWVKMLEEKGDIEFDQLQFTLIKLWTPVAVYHTSTDGKWYYVQAPYVRGWVESKHIAFFKDQDAVKEKVKSKDYVVVTGESVPVYAGPDFTAVLDRPSMGTVIPRVSQTDTAFLVEMPKRGEGGKVVLGRGYIKLSDDARTQFPPYTQANVIRQAFKLLSARYGWGGTYMGRDCSGFTFDVFTSMGVDLPRDSDQQAFAGTQLGSFKPFEQSELKKATLRQAATPGITLLRMKMHMMLYLGEIDEKFYVIHSTWAERIGQDPVKDEKNRINQVVVSDLDLNGNSYLGPLFHRIIQMSEVN
ncbi:MAG: hypothetical protein COV74_05810 [Candidatus Omnitrophica bacterium CG11_big_fil_rev_8_21_14_0_20_45_26]|uniref:Glycoside hydrolase n=1 Tax=Candidatus Abzuiibacterium crystallinum TaxID=1974748 RepID=A0A2H0LP34_9BACT|nr:MAG: hypothetical protein COV74_05810 [Candidatus Omnitrophica bacterium CG11_big_fil_rev_8_21_14_0_20_45_26]PIW64084.1 MAG: hypothetical protein COW12_07545 [Candidatus Omnitrophica bacterium CG12_big_fil_rev_8_21_14_0_65_45_16]